MLCCCKGGREGGRKGGGGGRGREGGREGGKKGSWQNTPGLTETLLALTNAPSCFSLGSLHTQKLERFVVIMYSKECGLAKVNEARHRLFTSGKKTLENIPPSL